MKTPSRTMWSLIDAARRKSDIRMADLAKLVHVHPNTVTADAANPDRIPQGRLWLYCTATGLPIEKIIKEATTQFANILAE